ncbi:MAG: DUF1513 domain-containing protein [Rhodobacteraceae bacterium]|nr:DUF1513 domain-containing protein [Paracoccaceae bacterium]
MVNRRGFLTGLLASGLVPVSTWADVGSPSFLAAARLPDDGFALCGIDSKGAILFQIPIPARGHAAAAHPVRAEAVAFARRPGTFASIINCASGREIARLASPEGRHFYGHGAFSGDGETLFTTENDYEAGQGRIGMWDATQGYARIGEFASGGIGPHDIRLLSDGATLVVANGGIDTHPDTGRTKLNLSTMRPNLSYLDFSGTLLDQVELPADLRSNSIRHLDVSQDGQVAMGMQWQRDRSSSPALVGVHRRGGKVNLMQAPLNVHRNALGYVGSIAFSGNNAELAVTCPRGGCVQVFDAVTCKFVSSHEASDASGITGFGEGFVISSGIGRIRTIGKSRAISVHHSLEWDNHLVRI